MRRLRESAKPSPVYPPNGEKRNNPHPLEPFLVWRIPRTSTTKTTRNANIDSRPQLMNASDFDRAMRGKLASTYQCDYLEALVLRQRQHRATDGCGAGDNSTRSGEQQNQLSAASYSLDSTMRNDFRHPATTTSACGPAVAAAADLRVSTTRYGSNADKHRPSAGAVPDVPNGIHMTISQATTYDHDFGFVDDDVTSSPRDQTGCNDRAAKPVHCDGIAVNVADKGEGLVLANGGSGSRKSVRPLTMLSSARRQHRHQSNVRFKSDVQGQTSHSAGSQ